MPGNHVNKSKGLREAMLYKTLILEVVCVCGSPCPAGCLAQTEQTMNGSHYMMVVMPLCTEHLFNSWERWMVKTQAVGEPVSEILSLTLR